MLQYFGPEGQDGEEHTHPFNYSNATVPEAVEAFKQGADDMVMRTVQFKALASALGVKVASYESGPGYGVGAEKPGTKVQAECSGASWWGKGQRGLRRDLARARVM